GNGEDIDGGLGAIGIGREPQFFTQAIEPVEHGHVGPGDSAAETQLGDGVASNQHRDIDGRDHVGEDHHAVLRHLGIGNTLHATQYRIEEHDRHADHDTQVDIDLQIPGEDDTDPTHL